MELPSGKYKGSTIEQVWQTDAEYVRWLTKKHPAQSVRNAARQVIENSLLQDKQNKEQLQAELERILSANNLRHLQKYSYRKIEVYRDYGRIEFCTHKIEDGFNMTDAFWTEDWDLVQIATSYEGLYEVDEEDYGTEPPIKRFTHASPAPYALGAMWYPLPDFRGQDTLSVNPVTLLEAICMLEMHLATRGNGHA